MTPGLLGRWLKRPFKTWCLLSSSVIHGASPTRREGEGEHSEEVSYCLGDMAVTRFIIEKVPFLFAELFDSTAVLRHALYSLQVGQQTVGGGGWATAI